jgi:hypothetical protein
MLSERDHGVSLNRNSHLFQDSGKYEEMFKQKYSMNMTPTEYENVYAKQFNRLKPKQRTTRDFYKTG